MNCWVLLGIEEYSDKKTIKTAYAKLLKVTNPDDDPQGFKLLHAAYKEALAEIAENKEISSPQWFTPPAKESLMFSSEDKDIFQDIDQPAFPPVTPQNTENSHNNNKDINEPLNTLNIDVQAPHQSGYDLDEPFITGKPEPNTTSSISHLISNEETSLEADDYNAKQQQEILENDWDDLISKTNHVIQTKSVDSTIEDWRFLEKITSIIDLEFRSQASDRVFEIVSEINSISLEKKVLLVKPPILDYLNGLFQWDKKWQNYSEYYDTDQIDAVFPYLTDGNPQSNNESKSSKNLFYYRRIGAYALDLVVALAIYKGVKLLLFLFDNHDSTTPIVAAMLYLFIIMPLMEMSPLQASIGKKTFGLIVVNGNTLRMPWYQSFWRTIATLICLVGFKLVVWINFYLAYKKGVLLQDVMSKSYVARGRKQA